MANPLMLYMVKPRVLIFPQQLTPTKFKVSLIIEFKSKIMCYLLELYFSMFTLTN